MILTGVQNATEPGFAEDPYNLLLISSALEMYSVKQRTSDCFVNIVEQCVPFDTFRQLHIEYPSLFSFGQGHETLAIFF